MCIATATPSRTKYILKSSCLNWCGLFLWVTIMTIQSVNLTVPGGDTPRSAFTKINANFTDQTNAASRLVGSDGRDKIPTVGLLQEAINSSLANGVNKVGSEHDANDFGFGKHYTSPSTVNGVDWGFITTSFTSGDGRFQFYNDVLRLDLRVRIKTNKGAWTPWHQIYTSANTTTDGNGYIKPSSPVLRVFNDRIEGNDDGERMSATYTKNGVGDYTITGTAGLRSDGWYITIPNDINGNPHVAVTLDDADGVITLKTYARIFDMTTFKFVPDLDQPLDIPDGRWIDLRFNDLPNDDAPLPDEV